MDLKGPIQVENLAGKKYMFVFVDDFSRYTWVRFIREKSETVNSFRIWALLRTHHVTSSTEFMLGEIQPKLHMNLERKDFKSELFSCIWMYMLYPE